MMKSFITLLALAASVSAEALAGPGANKTPLCAPAAKSCSKLPAKATRECTKSIQNLRLDVKTCTTPSSTSVVTVTKTAKEKKWPTTTVEVVSTYTSTEHVNTTVTVTEVTTSSTTITNTEHTEVSSTITYTEDFNTTATETVSQTTTTTATVTTDPLQETCKVKRATGPVQKRGWNALPGDCSCFLTATSITGVATTTTTITVTPTVTVTTTIPTKEVLSSTWTITELATSTAVEQILETITETATISVTEVKSVTWTLSATETTTEVTTATETARLDVCANYPPHASAISSPNTWPDLGPAKNFKDCCRQCFGKKNCVFFDFDPQQKVCKIFPNSKKKDCITDSCPKGKADVSLKKPAKGDKDQYGLGPCAATA